MQNQCLKCNHYQLSKKKCKAFPRGIPPEIFQGLVDHRVPFKGDRGITFEDMEIDPNLLSLIQKQPKVVRRDLPPQSGVIEHFSLTNTETGKAKDYLVLPLPDKFIKRGRGS